MPSLPTQSLRLGTRGSLLARMQSQQIADTLMQLHPGLAVELIIVKTTGDRVTDRPLHDIGGKGLFTREIEQALIDRTIDFAVHSYKDLPVTMPLVDESKLIIAAVPEREDPRDVLVSADARSIESLPAGAVVGTGSLRRQAQLLEARGDLIVQSLRGNVDTRLKKRAAGDYAAILLAAAGLKRSGLFDAASMFPLDPTHFIPAAAQGALAVQCHINNEATSKLLSTLNHPSTAECVAAERAFVAELNGDCHSPIAIYIERNGSQCVAHTAVAARGGHLPVLRASAPGDFPQAAMRTALHELRRQGVEGLLLDGR